MCHGLRIFSYVKHQTRQILLQLDGSTSTPKHRIAKGKNSGGSSLAWEDDNVIMIGMKSSDKSGNNNSSSSIGGAVSNSTRPVRKHGLNPPDTGSQPHSPSTSPKMKRKTLTSSCPQRPPAIDNSPLLASSPNKVCGIFRYSGSENLIFFCRHIVCMCLDSWGTKELDEKRLGLELRVSILVGLD